MLTRGFPLAFPVPSQASGLVFLNTKRDFVFPARRLALPSQLVEVELTDRSLARAPLKSQISGNSSRSSGIFAFGPRGLGLNSISDRSNQAIPKTDANTAPQTPRRFHENDTFSLSLSLEVYPDIYPALHPNWLASFSVSASYHCSTRMRACAQARTPDASGNQVDGAAVLVVRRSIHVTVLLGLCNFGETRSARDAPRRCVACRYAPENRELR